jgi:hypothetical protein
VLRPVIANQESLRPLVNASRYIGTNQFSECLGDLSFIEIATSKNCGFEYFPLAK